MIPKINKILVATDLSPNSDYVFRYALNSAIHHNAKLIILHVIEVLPPTAQVFLSTYVTEDLHEEKSSKNMHHIVDLITEKLDQLCRNDLSDAPGADDRVEDIQTCEGYPAEVILKKADELDCDAIVMGSHGKGIISQTFLGSVSKRVLRRTRKPVLIIPLPEETSE